MNIPTWLVILGGLSLLLHLLMLILVVLVSHEIRREDEQYELGLHRRKLIRSCSDEH